MPLERRIAAAELFWDDEQSTDQQIEAVAAIASHMKFRTKSVVGLAPEKRANTSRGCRRYRTPSRHGRSSTITWSGSGR